MPSLLNEEELALDPYKVLELQLGATDKDIKKAYRKFSLKYHPDKNQSSEAGESLDRASSPRSRADALRLAVVLFRKVTVAHEVLTDSAKRNYLDTRLEEDRRRQAKYETMNKKKREMVDVSDHPSNGDRTRADVDLAQALNAREEEAKRARTQQVQKRKDQVVEEEIMEAGKRMVEEAQKTAAAIAAKATKPTTVHAAAEAGGRGSTINGFTSAHNNGVPGPSSPRRALQTNGANGHHQPRPDISSDELTLIMTFSPLSSISSSSTSLQSILEARYGPITHLILKDPPVVSDSLEGKKKKKAKGKRAVVEFPESNWNGCWACWIDHTSDDHDSSGIRTRKPLELGTKVRWMKDETPSWIDWASRQQIGSNGTSTNHQSNSRQTQAQNGSEGPEVDSAPSFGSAPDLVGGTTMESLLARHHAVGEAERAKKAKEDEYESMTLFRMRQTERDRLAEQIRREEEDEKDD